MLRPIVGDRADRRKRFPAPSRRSAFRAVLLRLFFAGRKQVPPTRSATTAGLATETEACKIPGEFGNGMTVAWQDSQPNSALQPPENIDCLFQNTVLSDFFASCATTRETRHLGRRAAKSRDESCNEMSGF
jgi:hypothetical protein